MRPHCGVTCHISAAIFAVVAVVAVPAATRNVRRAARGGDGDGETASQERAEAAESGKKVSDVPQHRQPVHGLMEAFVASQRGESRGESGRFRKPRSDRVFGQVRL